jgi:uncharacterized membrane protein
VSWRKVSAKIANEVLTQPLGPAPARALEPCTERATAIDNLGEMTPLPVSVQGESIMNDPIAGAHAARRFAQGPGVGADRAGTVWSGVGRVALALILIGLGVRGLWTGEFAATWQRIPIEHLPGRAAWAYATAAAELALGLGLPWRRIAVTASWALLAFTTLWAVLLKLPAVVAAPAMEATWLGLGELTVIVAAAWLLFLTRARMKAGAPADPPVWKPGIAAARALYALSLLAIGLSHFFYITETVGFVPAWLPYPVLWAYLTGAGDIAACLGILLGTLPRLAASLEAAMLMAITLLVWLPGAIAAPGDSSLTPLLMSAIIASGAWVVADSYRGLPWRTMR